MKKIQENQIKELVATLKFGEYCLTHNPPVLWRTIYQDFGFDGEVEFTQIDKNNNLIPAGQNYGVIIKAAEKFSDYRLSFTNLDYYTQFSSNVLLVVYDIKYARLFAKKLSDIKIRAELKSQTIEFQETDEIKPGDNKLFSLLGNVKPDIQLSENEWLSNLISCSAGKESWKTYENTCIGIIDFLFQESFRNYHRIVQSRNENGLDIKDLIIPNRSAEPFWNEVRMDYDSRNIVFEFKNYDDLIGKNQLLQISNYLKKRTYGRFGVVFCRKGLSENGVIEQRELLRDDDKLIIVLSDDDVMELVKQKGLGQKPETFLERLKTELELSI